jgi:hypothetical protein
MSSTLTVALSFALVLAIAALCREVRLRRAVQEIVRRLVAYFRSTAHETRPEDTARPGDRPADHRV